MPEGNPHRLGRPLPPTGAPVTGAAGIRGLGREWGGGLARRGRTRTLGGRGGDASQPPSLPTPRRGDTSRPGVVTSSPHPPPRASPKPSSAPPPPQPLLLSTSSLPLFPAPDTSCPRLPPGAAKFLRSGPRAEPGPGRSGAPTALSPRADPGPGPGPTEPCCAAAGGAVAAGPRSPRCRPRSRRPFCSRPQTAAPRGPGCGR